MFVAVDHSEGEGGATRSGAGGAKAGASAKGALKAGGGAGALRRGAGDGAAYAGAGSAGGGGFPGGAGFEDGGGFTDGEGSFAEGGGGDGYSPAEGGIASSGAESPFVADADGRGSARDGGARKGASRVDEVKRMRARAALVRKRVKTPLEDALAAEGGARAVRLVQWARAQKNGYDVALSTWRANRRRYAQEAQDVFSHRLQARGGHGAGGVYGCGGGGAFGAGGSSSGRLDEENGGSVFEARNESLNVIAGLAEFAAAQCEQDIFGGEPWFAARPVGAHDPKLADEIQRHLQWVFRDGRLVDSHSLGIDHAVTLGECFTKTFFHVEVDEHEARVPCLHIDGKPAVDKKGEFVTTDAQVKALGNFKGKAEWKEAYERREVVTFQGVESVPIHFNDISFREDAPELELRHTNVYVTVEMSVAEARKRFGLSKEDAIRLALCAEKGRAGAGDHAQMLREEQVDACAAGPLAGTPEEELLGEDEAARMLNTRVRLIEGYILADVLGNGTLSRVCVVFPPAGEDWILWADYLANISPKGELPVKVDVWEAVPHKLYGRGFFAKYAYVQQGTDNLWNQVQFRNAMHANPITGIHAENMMRDEDDGDLIIKPGLSIAPKANKKLQDCIEFAQLPDLDNRSMELMQIGMQMAQLRSGITSASQGDLSTVPESNTATGIRSLMSRAAVLLKKPVGRMRRSKGRAFSYAVKLYYANFDREEAFVWGEGKNAELVKMTPEKVENLDIDVRMLLTQEQNQTKLEGAQVASGLIGQWLQVPEAEKGAVRPLFLQAIKALDFDQANEIVRQPVVKIEDCVSLLSPEEAKRLKGLLEGEAGGQSTEGGAESEGQSAESGAVPEAMAGGGGLPPELMAAMAGGGASGRAAGAGGGAVPGAAAAGGAGGGGVPPASGVGGGPGAAAGAVPGGAGMVPVPVQ